MQSLISSAISPVPAPWPLHHERHGRLISGKPGAGRSGGTPDEERIAHRRSGDRRCRCRRTASFKGRAGCSNLPATNNAAVDGYAVDAGFLEGNPAHEFRIIGKAAAGHPFSGTIGAGEAVRIFTGAVMPQGADAVAMQEFCDADEVKGTVRIARRLAPGSNNRPAGENLRAGETIARSGYRLGALKSASSQRQDRHG